MESNGSASRQVAQERDDDMQGNFLCLWFATCCTFLITGPISVFCGALNNDESDLGIGSGSTGGVLVLIGAVMLGIVVLSGLALLCDLLVARMSSINFSDVVLPSRRRDDVSVSKRRDDVSVSKRRDDVSVSKRRDDVSVSKRRDNIPSGKDFNINTVCQDISQNQNLAR